MGTVISDLLMMLVALHCVSIGLAFAASLLYSKVKEWVVDLLISVILFPVVTVDMIIFLSWANSLLGYS